MATPLSTPESPLRIAIFGVGAMGALFASRLCPVAQVTLIGPWPAQIQAITQHGLLVRELDGSERPVSLAITRRVQEVEPADVALILVKSHQTAAVALLAKQVVNPSGLAITLQNGLGNLEILARELGDQRTTLGVTAQGATILAPGKVRHAGDGLTVIADLPHRHSLLTQFAAALNLARVRTELRPTEQTVGLAWGKLAVNAGINPLTALFEVPNGDLLEDPRLRQLMIAATCEAATVAVAQGIELPFGDPAEEVVAVAARTATNHSSMWQDVRRGAVTEIEAISGAVVAAGRQHQVAAPLNARLYDLVCAESAGQRFTHDELFAELSTELLVAPRSSGKLLAGNLCYNESRLPS